MQGVSGDVEFSLNVFSTRFGSAERRKDVYAGWILAVIVSALGLLFWLGRRLRERTMIYRFFNQSGVKIVDIFASGPDAYRWGEFAQRVRGAITRRNSRDSNEPTGLE